jgi:hypothetical protein
LGETISIGATVLSRQETHLSLSKHLLNVDVSSTERQQRVRLRLVNNVGDQAGK